MKPLEPLELSPVQLYRLELDKARERHKREYAAMIERAERLFDAEVKKGRARNGTGLRGKRVRKGAT